MVPWRATEDGFVTHDVLDWYERFARGRPGVLVVEATGVRDIPSGPLLRIGHDRFIPGLRELVERVRAGERRRHAAVHPDHRLPRDPAPAGAGEVLRALSRARRSASRAPWRRQRDDRVGWDAGAAARPADEDVRDRLLALPDAELERVLDARELEALRFGYRERVTDVHLPHIRDLPAVLPATFADAAARARAGRASTASSCTTRTRTRWRRSSRR